jgi:predicted ATPase/class 3 adenylate cyclase
VQPAFAVTTFLFTDIEGSSRLWEQEPERMRAALARHDAIVRTSVEGNRGVVVKMTGDGVDAAFEDPLDAIEAVVQLQQAVADPSATAGIGLRVRCGLHAGTAERRDDDYFGNTVNRAARIMSAAHGGQVLLSQAVAVLVRDRLPARVALRDLGALKLRGLAQPEQVYQLVHPQLRDSFPALRSLAAVPNNLPQHLTSFVGRGNELTEIGMLLGRSRLLTLLGVGGIGKTRLSLEFAATAMDDYPDGVWLVELAPLTVAQLVPQAVASVLGVKEEAKLPVVEALVTFVKDRRLLLILDNCEHLVQACAELAARLIHAGPHLKILASSREHLHVGGETIYPVPALVGPDPSQALTLADLMKFEAVHLFVERAQAAHPSFAVTDKNGKAVAEICHRLDGIPLAIELAAARVRAMSVEMIASRLDERFRLLTSGDRSALPRQQTLRALIDWSHELLTQRERAIFRRLAVFAGGWTLDAAEIVGVDGDVAQADVLDLLTNLVEKSLVSLGPQDQRYRLLETVRQYAQERLDESGEADRARARHLACYVALAETARPELVGPKQGAWLARLDLERENFLAAHSWCDRAGDGAELGLRLVSSVWRYWLNRGLLGLGHRLTVEALARAGARERTPARCRTLFDAGQLASSMGRYVEAQGYLEESLTIARELGDKGRIAALYQTLSLVSLGQGDVAGARLHLGHALASARELGDKRRIAAALNALAQLHRLEGQLDTAEPLYDQVLSLARELGDSESIAIALLNLAMVSIGRSSADRAQSILREALSIAEEVGSKPAGQSVLEVSAGLGAAREEWERAGRFFGAAEAQTTQSGLHRDPADEAFLAPLIAEARKVLGTEAFATIEAAGRALSYDEAMAEVRTWLANQPPGRTAAT